MLEFSRDVKRDLTGWDEGEHPHVASREQLLIGDATTENGKCVLRLCAVRFSANTSLLLSQCTHRSSMISWSGLATKRILILLNEC